MTKLFYSILTGNLLSSSKFHVFNFIEPILLNQLHSKRNFKSNSQYWSSNKSKKIDSRIDEKKDLDKSDDIEKVWIIQ